MPRRRARGNVDFSRLPQLRLNLVVGVGNTRMWNEISTMTPLGYRASFLAYFKFPASFASYMYGVSPALMSQNNYKEDIETGMQRQRFTHVFTDNEMLGAWKVLAKMYYDNTANPNTDVPSRIRRQEGVSAATIGSFKVFVNQLALTAADGVTQDAASVADAPLAQTMPVEGVSVSIDGDGNNVSADEEVIAEMSAGMDGDEEVIAEMSAERGAEEGEDEVVTSDTIDTGASGLPANIVLMEGVFALYGSYFARSHSLNSRSSFISSLGSQASTRNAAQAILTLENLGFNSRAIVLVLYSFSNRNLRLRSVNAGYKTNYGAYIVLDLVGNPRARAYQSAVSQDIMRVMAGEGNAITVVDQFSRQTASGRGSVRARPALQTFRFSGMRRGAVVGVQVLSLNYRNGETYELSTSQGHALLRQAKTRAIRILNTFQAGGLNSRTDATSSTDTQPTTGTPTATQSGLQFYLIGYQQFTPTQTFRERAQLRSFGGLQGENKSYVFYFATLDPDERISGYYRSVFGEARLDVSSFDVRSMTSVTTLKNAWNDSGNLDARGVLKISQVPQSDVNNLRQALQQIVAFGLDTSLSRSQFTPTRGSSDRFGNVPFTDINRRSNRVLSALRSNLGENEIVLGANTQASGGQSDEATSSSERGLTTTQLITVQKQTFTRGFGIEIEGNFDETSKDAVARLLTAKGFPTKSTGYHGDAPRGYFKLERDGSVDNDMGGTTGVFEMVSPVLKGEEGITKLSGVLQVIRSQGARTSPSAGTHIHFGYADYGNGQSGFEKRKRLIVNFCVLQPFLLATQIAQSRNRYYAKKLNLTPAKIKNLADSPDYDTLRSRWSSVGGGRGVLHLKEGYGMRPSGVPTYEFRFPASNFETDTNINMVRLIEKVWSASIEGYLPHSEASSKPKQAEEWLEDLLGQELFSFWKNRYRDLQSTDAYVESADHRHSALQTASGRGSNVSNKLLPKLNSW